MIKHFFSVVFLFFVLSLYSQENKTTIAIAHGTGLTKTEAEKKALRSAIEQTFGVFLSSSTQILNDKLISDDIATLTSGNIKSFEIISSEQLSGGQWGVTVKAYISLSSLESFVSSKGYDVQLNSKLFALNMRQQEMNEVGELKVLTQTIGLLHNEMQNAYDYKLEVIGNKKFKSVKGKSDLFEIRMQVISIPNTNFFQCVNYLFATLDGISMPNNEVVEYKKIGKEVVPLHIRFRTQKGKNINKDFKLRSRQSAEALSLFFNLFNFYSRLYEVDSGIDVQVSPGVSKHHKLYKTDYSCAYTKLSRDWKSSWFLKDGYQTYNNLSSSNGGVDLRAPKRYFTWVETRSLLELENMNDIFDVNPLGIVMPYKHGGIVLKEDENGNGYVLSFAGRFGFHGKVTREEITDSISKINKSKIGGFDDWRILRSDESQEIGLYCKDLWYYSGVALSNSQNTDPFYHLFNFPWVSGGFNDCLDFYSERRQPDDYERLKHAKGKYRFVYYNMGKYYYNLKKEDWLQIDQENYLKRHRWELYIRDFKSE